MAQLEHITPEQVAQYGVVAAPDRLIGRPQENKAVFDRLVRELVAVVVNAIIDKTNELLTAESVREEHEEERVAAEAGRVEAENGRAAAELARAAAEALRQTNELHRENGEQYRQDNERERELAEQQRADETAGIVAQAAGQAERAVQAAQSVTNMARTAESWAVGGTGTREGEDTDNAKYWSALAQVAAGGDNVLYADAFGAAGDGVTDDTAAIQAAINFAQENNLPVLSFTPGRSYKITSVLSITKALSLYGNGAALLSYVESGPILTVCGSMGSEVTLGADVSAQSGESSAISITTAADHGFSVGDRIILQSQRDALAEDSGLFWCGTPTGSTETCQYAEVLTVNQVTDATHFSCTGSLLYPFYQANRDPAVDVSTLPGQREHSTVRKASFLTGVEIRDLRIEAYGAGDTSADNTLVLHLCADSVVRGVRLTKHNGHGRGLAFQNCLNTGWENCVVASKHTYNDYMETHAIDNHFTFSACWYCYADGCASYHAGQSFDATYSAVLNRVGKVRCPTLYPAVRGCLVHEPINSAATNHSGSFGCTYENSRFVNFARPMAVRSPHTLIHGCQFSCKSTRDSDDDSGYAITVSEPTTFGTRIENCLIACDCGIQIIPYTGNLPSPPKQKKKGIQIVNNTFFSVRRRAIYVSLALMAWNYVTGASSGDYTDFAVDRTELTIDGNLFFRCGDGDTATVYVDNLTNGVSVCGNRFVQCKASTHIININTKNTDISVCGNLFSGCQGTAGFTYTPYLNRSDGRNAKLDANYHSRNVYRDNVSCDSSLPVCDYTGITHVYAPNIGRVSGEVCGQLFSNPDSPLPEDVGWIGTLTEGSKSISPVLAGEKVCTITPDALSPADDNLKALGSAGHRWKDIYCAAGAISTSDRNQKTDLAGLPEQVLEAWGKVGWKLFRFQQAVEEKGDKARLHVGLVAQDIQQAFADAGLDAANYGLFCADTVPDGAGGEKTVLGIRYAEALALECAWLRRQLEKLAQKEAG